MCLAQGPQHSDAGEARTRGPLAFWSSIDKKSGNFAFTLLDIRSSCFPSLVPCLKLLYVTSPQKQVDVSLVLKDSDTEFVDPAFCIRWPENRPFKMVSSIGI